MNHEARTEIDFLNEVTAEIKILLNTSIQYIQASSITELIMYISEF